MTIAYCVVLVISLAFSTVPRSASAQDGVAPTLLRKRFGGAEGSPSVTNKITQTRDGFLWFVGGGSNLIRFDGKNFFQFEKSEAVGALAGAPDGDLWVGETSRLLRIPAATLSRSTLTEVEVHTFTEPGLKITELWFSKQGVLWIGTFRGLFRYDHERVEAVGPRSAVRSITETPDGRIFVATFETLLEVVGSTVTQHAPLARRLGVQNGEIFEALTDSHGTTWYATPLGTARESSGQLERIAPYGPNGLASFLVHEDAHGRIWIAKDLGLFRVTSNGLELVAPIRVNKFFNDGDGDLWVATLGDGLYRFKAATVRMFTTADGLPGKVISQVIEAQDGTIWAGANCGGIARFDGRRFQALGRKDGLSDLCVQGLAEDDHDLWVATVSGAFRFRNGVFDQLSRSEGLPDTWVNQILHARDGSLWFATRLGGISRLKDGGFHTFTIADGLPANQITQVTQDGEGVIWVGTPEGIAKLVNERFQTFSLAPRTHAFPVGEDRDGGFYVTYRAERGNVTRRIDRDGNANAVGLGIASMLETNSGELWISGAMFARVWPGQLSHPPPRDEPLDYETFSAEDGLAADVESDDANHVYKMILARDGTIWASTTQGIAMFDPRRLPITRTKPLVYLTGMTIGRSPVHPEQEIVLPPGTGRVEFDFAAVEISAPAKIRMQYRLEGVDSEWLDAGAEPKAIYNTLSPGRHTLRIRASNRSGIWDRDGVVFTVMQQPFFYQTRWFAAVVVASALLVIVAAYRRRVRHISLAMSARFDERLAERTRVARELHDTLLQSFHGAMFRFQGAANVLPDRPLEAKQRLESALKGGLDAIREARDAIQGLRASATEKNDLADALCRAIDDCRIDSTAQITFSVEGRAREMHPVVRDEIYRVGYEAIRNACVHSRGSQVVVHLEYGSELKLRISDNGVGIDAEMIAMGKEGHFGLSGMRERAERIGATFTVVGGRGTGSAITLVVPGRTAFLPA
jgi:signal transduction histidine kinase/ligand-binding sensor domain-containing protein